MVADAPIHYAPESDDAGMCGLTGLLVETQEHVNCPWCVDLMRAANIRAGLRADGSAVGGVQ